MTAKAMTLTMILAEAAAPVAVAARQAIEGQAQTGLSSLPRGRLT